MSANSKKVEELSETAVGVENKINDLSAVMGEAITMTDKSVDSYIQTGEDTENIINCISQINDYSQKNAKSIEDIASASKHMNEMTETLNNKLSEFKT